MKYLFFIFIIIISGLCKGQPVVVDIDDNAQNKALADTAITEFSAIENIDFSSADFIRETYQIPAYALYGQLWDKEHLRSKQFAIPFSDGRLKIILIDPYNTPFVFPCRGNLLLNYGQIKNQFHTGVDFILPVDNSVYACFDGVVRMAKVYGNYKKMVVVRHYNGLETVYAILDKIFVKPGQIVKAGHLLGQAGISGKNVHPTFHFEVRFMNEHFNPALMLDFEERALTGNILTLESTDFVINPIPVKKEPGISEQTTPPPPTYRPTYHVIEKGETLYKIARKYNISVEELLKINNLTDNSTIYAGQKIKVK